VVTPTSGSEESGFLFDTSVVIAAFRNERAVADRLRKVPATSLFIPTIVLGELTFGALASSRVEENLRRLWDFETTANTLPCDAAAARFYGEIKSDLKRRGSPLPENDIWIAAIARQHRLTLVTRDTHFARVAGLEVESW
jgi:tRNA(fMet)-specific endonuclease VapC